MKKFKSKVSRYITIMLVLSMVMVIIPQPVEAVVDLSGVWIQANSFDGQNVMTVNVPENSKGSIIFGLELKNLPANQTIVADNYVSQLPAANCFIEDQMGANDGMCMIKVGGNLDYENPGPGWVDHKMEFRVICFLSVKDKTNQTVSTRWVEKTLTLVMTDVVETSNPPDRSYYTYEDTTINVDAPGLLAGIQGTGITANAYGEEPKKGTVKINSDGSFSYVPRNNFYGPDSFSYTLLNNGILTGKNATVSVYINGQPDSPVAENDTATCVEDGEVDINVLLNDYDPDNYGQAEIVDTFSINAVTQSINGGTVSVTQDGKIRYKPKVNFNGTDSFTYSIKDTQGYTGPMSTATVTINVVLVYDPPVALDDTAQCDDNSFVVVDVLANDRNPDNVALSISGIATPAHGTAEIVNNKIKYTPTKGYLGTDTLTYRITDGTSYSQGNLSITVNNVQYAPVAKNDNFNCIEDKEITLDVLANDSDADNDELTITSVTPSPNATITITQDKKIIYKPNANYNGTDSFSYTISDGNGGTATATVDLTVREIYDMPVANTDSYFVNANSRLTIKSPGVLKNDIGIEGNLTAKLNKTADHGSLTLYSDGSFIYQPKANWTGKDSFTYRAYDGKEYSEPVVVTITVTLAYSNPGNDESNSETTGKVPFLQKTGETDKAITNALRTAEKGGSVEINMNTTTILQAEWLEVIAGNDVNVIINMGDGIKWLINGKSITGTYFSNLDFAVTLRENKIPANVISKITSKNEITQLTIKHSGTFGFTAILSLNLGSNNYGLYANLFYYNNSKGALEFSNACRIGEDGSVAWELTHASSYAILIDSKSLAPSVEDDEKTENPQTGEGNTSTTLIITFFILAALFLIKRKLISMSMQV